MQLCEWRRTRSALLSNISRRKPEESCCRSKGVTVCPAVLAAAFTCTMIAREQSAKQVTTAIPALNIVMTCRCSSANHIGGVVIRSQAAFGIPMNTEKEGFHVASEKFQW